MNRLKINLLGLSEVRWKHAGSFKTDDFTMLYSGGDQHERGVGVLLNKETSKVIKGFWAISDRIILVKLQGKPCDISIIQCYAPTSDYDDVAIANFYEQLDEAYKQCKSQAIIYVMGDFNAKVFWFLNALEIQSYPQKLFLERIVTVIMFRLLMKYE